MRTRRPHVILRLGSERRDEAVDVLVEAFRDYPAMRFMLGPESTGPERLSILIGSYVDGRLARGGPVLGIERGGELAAIALVDEPVPASQPNIVERASVAVRDRLGEATWRRIEAFENAVAGLEPDEPHHYIGMLGVRDRYRGEGLARRLVDDIAQQAIDDPDSRSVCLSTESVENLALYARLGFEVIGETRIESLQSWTLSRVKSDCTG